MGKKDPRIDAYIEKSADFARPILKHMRKAVHAGCPGVEETLKWSHPAFMFKGMFCGMAAFKSHCAFGFWKESLLRDRLHEALPKAGEQAMGQCGRVESLADLPDEKTFIALVKEAALLNELGVKPPPRKRSAVKKELVIPDYFTGALKKNRKAQATFDSFSYSNKKEYLEWITEAKTEQTRQRRLETAIGWMAEGKVRNWKYMP